MAGLESSYQSQSTRTKGAEEISGWAVGFMLFASMLMVLVGSFHFLNGLVAVLDDTFFLVRPNFALEIDVSTWGWVHMVGGIIIVIAGIALLTGNLAARIVAIFMAVVSAFWSFYSIPYYPVWSILMIAMAIGVIWALTAHGGELRED